MGLKVKEGVTFPEFNQYNLKILSAALMASNLMNRDIVVTSGNDGKHSTNSLHYKNRALDFRTRDMTPEDAKKFVSYMENQLSSIYDIVVETDPQHVHIEADRI